MKIALVTDIHGNLAALEAVEADIRRRGVDQTVNLGDSLSGPLLPLETAQYLMGKGWISLAGNHDRQILANEPESRTAADDYARSQLGNSELNWLRTLPPTVRQLPDVFLCHGTPSSDLVYFLETVDQHGIRPATASEVETRLGNETSMLIACGHTHTPHIVRSRRGQLIVNPGSVGLPAYEDDEPFHHTVETGSPDARYAIVEFSHGKWMASLLVVPYDHRPMAQLAKLRDREDWERALLTGYAR